MSKTKTEAADAEKPPVTSPEGQDTVAATDQAPEGQDTVAATDQAPEGQDAAANALLQVKAVTDAMAQAEAEAEAAAQPTTDPDGNPPSDGTPEPAPGPNLRVLNHLTKQVDMLNHYGLRQGLVDEMRDLYGAEIDELDGTFAISIEGVSIDPADSLENALTLWANAARRAILEATA